MAAKKEKITIRMPKALLAKWLAMLRDPKTKRARGTLLDNATGGMCCLGVLQVAAEGKVELYGFSGMPKNLPSIAWLKEHEVEFLDMDSDLRAAQAPYLPYLKTRADDANDAFKQDSAGYRFSFKRIANAIEKAAKGI